MAASFCKTRQTNKQQINKTPNLASSSHPIHNIMTDRFTKIFSVQLLNTFSWFTYSTIGSIREFCGCVSRL